MLPNSLIEPLGFERQGLVEQEVQTANGTVPALRGLLTMVDVGGAVVNDVAVMFLPDEHLGDQKLLGMSFLERFRLTIDDAKNEVVLRVQ